VGVLMSDQVIKKTVMRPLSWVVGCSIFFSAVALSTQIAQSASWTTQERQVLRSLWLGSLPPVPRDASNKFENQADVIKFGQVLFNEKELSGNQEVSCATCHDPNKKFSDNQELSEGMGLAGRHTPSIVGMAYSAYQFWDGRADSLWAQALGPLENPMEHGINRTEVVRTIKRLYANEYEKHFGSITDFDNGEDVPASASPLGDATAQQNWKNMTSSSRTAVNRAFVNIGKAMAAYVRTLSPKTTRFDQFVKALEQENTEIIFNTNELAGLKLFIGKANCITCHNGALFTDQQFHNTGIPENPAAPIDYGRLEGLKQLIGNEFNCRSAYSDAAPDQCLALAKAELDILESDVNSENINKNVAAFKTPGLRNVAQTMPYMHNGQLKNLKQVLGHYNEAPNGKLGVSQVQRISLSTQELFQLERFLETLNDVDETIR
jgi:cytochrome c peroxidase